MRRELDKMRAEEDRDQLAGMNPDDAFELGYYNAIIDLEMFTGPDPKDNK